MKNENYYFFAATFDPLSYGDEPPISSVEFRELCQKFLSKEDAAFLKFCYYDPKLCMETIKPTGSEFIDNFMQQERGFLELLASLRAKKLGRNIEDSKEINHSTFGDRVCKAASEMDDPLEAELYINKERWSALDELVNISYFEVINIYTYLLKLQLLERKRFFYEAKGTEEYQILYNKIIEKDTSSGNL